MPLRDYTCKQCDKQFQNRKKDKKFCSMDCYKLSKKNPEQTISCLNCDKEFTVQYRHRERKYCSRSCSVSNTKRKKRHELTCENCNKKYKVIEYRSDKSKFCSYDCFLNDRRGGLGATLIKQCEKCNNDFETTFIKRNKRFCSKSCANTGEFNGMYGRSDLSTWTGKPAWNAGLTAKTDKRLSRLGQKISKQMKEKFKSGELSNSGKNNPNFGRTRDTRTKEQLDNYSRAAIKRIKSSNSGFITGYYVSKKTNIRMKHRSSYERRMMVCLDIDPYVKSYDYESITITYGDDLNKRYIIDFDVEFLDNRKLIEVKSKDFLKDPVVIAKEKAAINYCSNKDITYSIYTLKEIEEYEKKLGIKNEK